jgi:Fe-S cluster biogenesis protein NfuA
MPTKHGGYVDLIEVREGTAYIQLGGGCQGCAQVDVTLARGSGWRSNRRCRRSMPS